MLHCALLLALASTVGAVASTQGLAEVAVARQELRRQLSKLLPQQQQDLGLLVPSLKAGDRNGFKAHLTRFVHNGGNARIKKCLEGLAVAGFDATEIQAWLQSESNPVPQSRVLKARVEKAQRKAQEEKQPKQQPRTLFRKLLAEEKEDQGKPLPKLQPVKQQDAQAEKPVSVQKPKQGQKEDEAADDTKKNEQKHQTQFAKYIKVLKEQQPIAKEESLTPKTDDSEGVTRVAKKGKEQAKQTKELEEGKQLAQQENHKEVKQSVKSVAGAKPSTEKSLETYLDKAKVVGEEKPLAQNLHKEMPSKPSLAKIVEDTPDKTKVAGEEKLLAEKVHKEMPSQQQSNHLRKRAAAVDPLQEENASDTSIAAVGTGAAAAAEQQDVTSAKGNADEDLKDVQSEKQRTDSQDKKASLRQELSKRLAKSVEANSRVQSLDKFEAELKTMMSADETRVSKLEEALQKEAEARKQAEKDNEELKAELRQEETRSERDAVRLEEIEKHELEMTKETSAADRIALLEEENAKFRSALAGAARRLVNVEALLAVKKQSKVKVIRHDKHAAEAAQ